MEVLISSAQALGGADLEVPTLDGKVRMRVPAKTPSEKVFNLKGLGMPILQRRGRGDLKVKVRVEVSSRLSKRDREASRPKKKGKNDGGEPSFRSVEN